MSIEKVYDWKGNEVKAGMTIYFVQTKPGVLESSRHGFVFTDDNGKTHQEWEPEENWLKRKNQEVWELGKPREVTEKEGRLFITEKFNDPNIEQLTHPLSMAFLFDSKPTIAIEGVSDIKD